MTTSEIALRIVEGWLAQAGPAALLSGISSSTQGAEVAKIAGESLGTLYDIVYKAVVATQSES